MPLRRTDPLLGGLAALPALPGLLDAVAAQAQAAMPLASWNDGPAKQAIRRVSISRHPRNVGFENAVDAEGQRLIWLDRGVVDRLGAMRGLGESYSDAILRIARETEVGDWL